MWLIKIFALLVLLALLTGAAWNHWIGGTPPDDPGDAH